MPEVASTMFGRIRDITGVRFQAELSVFELIRWCQQQGYTCFEHYKGMPGNEPVRVGVYKPGTILMDAMGWVYGAIFSLVAWGVLQLFGMAMLPATLISIGMWLASVMIVVGNFDRWNDNPLADRHYFKNGKLLYVFLLDIIAFCFATHSLFPALGWGWDILCGVVVALVAFTAMTILTISCMDFEYYSCYFTRIFAYVMSRQLLCERLWPDGIDTVFSDDVEGVAVIFPQLAGQRNTIARLRQEGIAVNVCASAEGLVIPRKGLTHSLRGFPVILDGNKRHTASAKPFLYVYNEDNTRVAILS